MNYKNIFILTFLIFLLPSVSSLASNDDTLSPVYQFYTSVQYKPSISYFSKFSPSIQNENIVEILSLKENLSATINNFNIKGGQNYNIKNFISPYNPTYKNSPLGIGGAIGVKSNNYRVELEVFYEEFDLKVPSEYFHKDAYKYFIIKSTPSHPHHHLFKNNDITVSPVLINVCYDIPPKNTKIFPYLCFGAGVDVIDFLDKVHFKVSYQAKIGISYFILPNLALFVDGSFYSHLSNKFTHIPTINIMDPPILPDSSSAKFNVNFLSSSFGIRFIH
ncbi:P44/Msp2 family outer membrane protein [Ehrlichia ruminantium]|uniref:P44/Msp2 family outer membrane protein n=1 Tax=Ehrlichia ruminantium TaxID=779 RepID=UPI000EF32FD0|nr:P44/Msp2 family outer membrane protein [Ehrlichia ruminantium]QLK58288.1 P44/Msp2 family outer membrane protein [Ehrlichia ruminantium]UOD97853.1 P44/Msp2 family outer membrane protein [Ehrlichia ruminantium]